MCQICKVLALKNEIQLHAAFEHELERPDSPILNIELQLRETERRIELLEQDLMPRN